MRKVLIKSCYILIVVAMLAGVLTGCAPEETPPQEGEFALSDTALELEVGETYSLTVSGNIGEVVWTTNSSQTVSVSSGKITALALGKATVTATDGENSIDCSVEVKECPSGKDLLRVNCSIIDYVTKSATVNVNQRVPVSTALYVDGQIQPTADITLSSTDSEVLFVAGNELVAKKAGTAKIVAETTFNGTDYASGEYVFTVEDKSVLSPTKSEIAILEPLDMSGAQNSLVNRTEQIDILVKAPNGTMNVLPSNEVEWSVENDEVATVQNGLVTSVSNGNTVVKAKYNGTEVSIRVNVMMPIYSADDMDRLGLATYNLSKDDATKMLSKNFVLMNDIDYSERTRNWIIPIASVNGEFFNLLRAEISINGDISYYSKSWEQVLGLSTAKVDSATILYRIPQTELDALDENERKQYEFKGINPNNIAFSGTFDGNGYSIKNAFLMADNVQYTSGKTYATGAQSFIGNLTGTLKNLSFENLYIGDNNILIDYDSTSENYLTHVYNKNGSQLYGPDNPLALYATYDKDAKGNDLYMKSYNGIIGVRTGRDQWGRRNATTSALVLRNSGKVENVYMSYSNTASECTVISGIALYNAGTIKNVVLVPVLEEYNDAACFDMGIGNPVAYKNAGMVQNVAVCHKYTTKQNYSSIFENLGETIGMVSYENFEILKGEPAYSASYSPVSWNSVEMKLIKNIYGLEE